MIDLKISWLVLLLVIQLPGPSSISADGKRRSPTKIIANLLAVRSYELGSNTTSPSRDDIRAARSYFENRHFESQLDLDLAELQAELMGTKEAQRFLNKACKYGLPSYDNLIFRDNFVLSYDNRLKQPVWSLEYLPIEKVLTQVAVKHKQQWFNRDESLHEYFRTQSQDYKNSGYERGHFSPACDNKADQSFLEECYLMSNVAPQVGNLNHAVCVWSRLEKYIFYLARRSKNTFVITGTMFLPSNGLLFPQERDPRETVLYRVISQKRIAAPSHFYKVVVAESFDRRDRFTMQAFVVPNSNAVWIGSSIERFRIDIDKELPQVERLTGLKFFEILNRLRVARPTRLLYGYRDALPPKIHERANAQHAPHGDKVRD